MNRKGIPFKETTRWMGFVQVIPYMAMMGRNPIPPVNIQFNPRVKIRPKMGGEFTYLPTWDPKTGFDHHSHLSFPTK